MAGDYDVRFFFYIYSKNGFIIVFFLKNFFQKVYYVLARAPDPYPPALDNYLNKIARKIGADPEVKWEESSDAVYRKFSETGKFVNISATLFIVFFFFFTFFHVSHKFYTR